jgi:hypothetical protein
VGGLTPNHGCERFGPFKIRLAHLRLQRFLTVLGTVTTMSQPIFESFESDRVESVQVLTLRCHYLRAPTERRCSLSLDSSAFNWI